MAYDTNLTIPNMKWLGLLPSDLEYFKISKSLTLPLSEQDIKKGEELRRRKGLPIAWIRELEQMIKSGVKAELESLSCHAISFLCKEYLPHKIIQSLWI